MVDFARREDADILKSMWQRIFEDDEDTLDFFFDNVFIPENTLVWRDQNRPEAMLYMIWNKEDGVYLYALATEEKYRGLGIMSELIKKALDILTKKGAEYVFLIPASDSLFSYYKKYGFSKTIDVTSAKITSGRESGDICLKDMDREALMQLVKMEWERECRPKWDEAVMEYVIFLEDKEEEYRFVSINNNGRCLGYMVLKDEGLSESVVQYGMTDECFMWLMEEECIREKGLVFPIGGNIPHTICGFIPF